MKKGLIMEGGAMRGMFTCGVLDVMMENDVRFDGAAGIRKNTNHEVTDMEGRFRDICGYRHRNTMASSSKPKP